MKATRIGTGGILAVQPLRGVREIDGPAGWWQGIGEVCTFRLLPGVAGLPRGWTRFSVQLRAPRGPQAAPLFQVDCGAGYRPLATLPLPHAPVAAWKMTAYVPPDAVGLTMSLAGSPGPLHLAPIRAAPVLRLMVGIGWSLPLALRLLRRPGSAAQAWRSLREIWRSQGRSGLRTAVRLRMLAGRTVASPPASADASSPADRYRRWIAEQEPDRRLAPPCRTRRFSLLVPVGAGEAARVAATLAALRLQGGAAWECLLGFAPATDPAEIAGILRRADTRVSAARLPTAERGAMLAALAAAAGGDLLLVLDPGDRLAPGALAALAATASDIAHGDEDRIAADGGRQAPFLKPGWSPDLLHAFNYFGRPTALRRDLVERAGGFRAGSGAGAEWDLHLRMAASASVRVARVPELLCHRGHGTGHPAPDRPAPGHPAAEDHRAAIAAHWRRQNLDAVITTQADGTQRSRVRHAVPPPVSVIIPDGSDPALLAGCLEALAGHSGDMRLQVVVVGGQAGDPAAARHGATVVDAPEPPSRAAACNAGARAARGTLLLFLDAGLRPSASDWLEELVDFALRPGVGVAGTSRVDAAGALLDAGFRLGPELCMPSFRGAAPSEWGVFGSALLARTLAVVAGGCQMVRREAFAQIGGFDETCAGPLGDAAFCLAARAAGWRVVHTPFAAMVGQAPGGGGIADDPDRSRLAADIRRLGYRQDPFFHPALDAGETIPRLRIGIEGDTLAHGLRCRGGEPPGLWPLDLGDDTAVSEMTGIAVGQLLWPAQHCGAIDDIWSAARWCLDLLRRRPDLRRRFPDALSAGADGAFAAWLAGAGTCELMLPPDASGHIRAALSAGIAARARHAVLIEAGLAGDMERAFLPSGRDRLFSFLLQRDGLALRREEVWWLALECAEDPMRELALSHRFNPAWQSMFRDGMTVFGQERFLAWFRAVHGDAAWIDPARCCPSADAVEQLRLAWGARRSWQERHPDAFADRQAAGALLRWLLRPDGGLPENVREWLARQPIGTLADAMAAPGVNVIGHFGYPSGIRTSVLAVVAGLRSAGLAVATRDVPVDAEHDGPGHVAHGGFELHDATLLHIQPEPFFARAFELAGLHARTPRTYRIGYWYWELEAAPAGWQHAVTQVDEIWVATRFVGDALRERFDIPVFDLMPGVELPPFRRRPPEWFGIPAGHFSLLFTFHMLSGMERKNPLGLIRAFRTAFPAGEPVVLVIKTSFGDRLPESMRRLRAAADMAGARVIVIDRVFTADVMISLMDACDAYVSLHRSEGLGLTMAEAMLLGKPVIATGYSGNTDFMNAANSLLVNHRLVRIDQAVPPYGLGATWAEPSEEHAAALMRQVWKDPAAAAAIGTRAQSDIRTNLSVGAAGQRMAARLTTIRAERCHANGHIG